MKPSLVSPRQLLTLALLLACLIAVAVLKRRCGEAVAGLFRAIDSSGPPRQARDGL